MEYAIVVYCLVTIFVFSSFLLQSVQRKKNHGKRSLPVSRTLDSLTEFAPKSNTPSSSSSGYISQAVSITNLSSDDSWSIKSISVDETPDLENKMNDLHKLSANDLPVSNNKYSFFIFLLYYNHMQ